jgi:MerR family transcriptional regulator, mercuric resistance operon regulatory protein
MQQGMTIGRLAKAAAVNVETIRYYQRRGLIGEPHKPPGGHRRYPMLVVEQIAFIRRAQQLGFSLAEVKSLMQHAGGGSLRDTRAIAEKKYENLEIHIAQLNKMRRRLKTLIERSRKAKGGTDPIIEALNTDE